MTLDLYGQGFVLLRLGADAPDAEPLHAAARRRGVPLEIVTITEPALGLTGSETRFHTLTLGNLRVRCRGRFSHLGI